MSIFDDTLLASVSEAWELPALTVVPGILPGGSPERVMHRAVVQDDSGSKFALEGISANKLEKRLAQAKTLHLLKSEGCPAIASWLHTTKGELAAHIDGFHWQLRSWIDGDPLPRETYGDDAWRGSTAARQLIALRQAATSLPPAHNPNVFHLHHYLHQLLPWIRIRNPRLLDDIQPIVAELHAYFDAEENLRLAFCHGDYHPFNILWKDQTVSGLIDWEFCGLKPEAYDAANLLGCIGMDNPEWLTAPFAMTFVNTLKDAGIFTAESWKYLPDMMAALRFAWMREWVNQKNRDMIIQELDYIWLLLDNRDLLRRKWA